MKKKVKILKNARGISLGNGGDGDGGGTFLSDIDGSFAFQTPNTNSDRDDQLSKESKLENMPKKKKALHKKDVFNRGLKYSAPSQRNHSSVYE